MTTKRIQRNLTIMFTDISGFTKHTEKISRDELMKRLETHNQMLLPIVAHFDGKIVKTIGDSFLITFESPTNAVECGTFMQHTLRKFNTGKPDGEQIHIKVSINAGEVTVTENDVFGDPVNVAAKIEKVTSPDEIYFTESVFLAMNKAEVPNTFVKMFRPKGAESQEIKLYKVVQDENDALYKRIVTTTNIDPAKIKTRVSELTTLAEREYMRYQDTLEQLVTQQGKSSRSTVVAVAVAALIIAAAILVGFVLTRGGDPRQQLEHDVRDFLKVDKPRDARTVVESYVKNHGEDDAARQMRTEIRVYESNGVEADAARLLAQGKPDLALSAIEKFVGSDKPPESLEKVANQCRSLLAAGKLLEEGDFPGAKKSLDDAFGAGAVGEHLKAIREKIAALETATSILGGKDADLRAEQAVSLLAAAYGDDTGNRACLKLLSQALTLDLCRTAKQKGAAAARARAADARKRFVHVDGWVEIEREIDLAGLWYAKVDSKYRNDYCRRQGEPDEVIWRLRIDAKERKDAEFLFRFADTLFDLDQAFYQARFGGLWDWDEAIKLDPTLPARHPELKDKLASFLGWEQDADYDEEQDPEHTRPDWAGRRLIAQYFYDELRAELIAGLEAKNKTGTPWKAKRINCFCILADKGEAGLLKDRYNFLKDALREFLTKQSISTSHARLLFAEPMSYQDYEDYRLLLDKARDDPMYSSFGFRFGVLDQMIKDLKETQPEHTARYGR